MNHLFNGALNYANICLSFNIFVSMLISAISGHFNNVYTDEQLKNRIIKVYLIKTIFDTFEFLLTHIHVVSTPAIIFLNHVCRCIFHDCLIKIKH